VIAQIATPVGQSAGEPPEARGLDRDGVRLLVGGSRGVTHHRFTELPRQLTAGDVLVVNRSATLPAAVDVTGTDLVLHLSTVQPDGAWLAELRRRQPPATVPYPGGTAGDRLSLPGGARATLRSRYLGGRLWVITIDTQSVHSYLSEHGRPIRYAYVPQDWPLPAYQTVFATEPGSAEMPSAARPFTPDLVTRLVTAGVGFAPITLHTGVASQETPEPPYPEWFDVPATTARLVSQARAAGNRVVAVGTTAARALESATDPDGTVRSARGWTDLVITPERGVRAVDGILTGFHEPRASHLDLLVAVAGQDLVTRCYAEAFTAGYRWHEFGDVNLLLRR
jgi:S-adenosylmethionine:tRNA ribosyltransferase-isomerase